MESEQDEESDDDDDASDPHGDGEVGAFGSGDAEDDGAGGGGCELSGDAFHGGENDNEGSDEEEEEEEDDWKAPKFKYSSGRIRQYISTGHLVPGAQRDLRRFEA